MVSDFVRKGVISLETTTICLRCSRRYHLRIDFCSLKCCLLLCRSSWAKRRRCRHTFSRALGSDFEGSRQGVPFLARSHRRERTTQGANDRPLGQCTASAQG